jgi:hypothetical protein
MVIHPRSEIPRANELPEVLTDRHRIAWLHRWIDVENPRNRRIMLTRLDDNEVIIRRCIRLVGRRHGPGLNDRPGDRARRASRRIGIKIDRTSRRMGCIR